MKVKRGCRMFPERTIRNHDDSTVLDHYSISYIKIEEGESMFTSEAIYIQVCHLEIKYRMWWLILQGNTETFWDIHYLFGICPTCLRNFLIEKLPFPHRCSYEISVTRQGKDQLLKLNLNKVKYKSLFKKSFQYSMQILCKQ